VTVSGNTGDLVRDGFGYGGWDTEADGSGNTYVEGDTFTMGASDTTLYALWGASGSLDTTFDPGSGADNWIYCAAVQSDGRILIGGFFTDYDGTDRNRIARLNADGTVDTSFNPGSGANDAVQCIAVQSDGRILIGGSFTELNGATSNHIARLNSDGSLDTSFDPGSGVDGDVNTIAVQPDGKILIAGAFFEYDGTVRIRVARLGADGSLDTSFSPGSGPTGTVYAIDVQSDGQILLGGDFGMYDGTLCGHIVRLDVDGGLDTSFDPGSGANDFVMDIKRQSNGKILISGGFTEYDGTARNYVARLNDDGSLDTSFGPGSGADNIVLRFALQPDGKMVIGGTFTEYAETGRNRIARLNTDGSLDESFDPGSGVDNFIYAVVLQPDGKILVSGRFSDYDGIGRSHIARVWH
jgi:uncharacterized delta-60 repeat protein